MKKSIFPIFFLVICLSLVAFQCEDENDSPLTQEEEKTALNKLKLEIESLVNTSVCNESNTCKYIAFGSKPCGGPWSYLTYSTSIDEVTLQNLVTNYNQKEADFNKKWGAISDCAFLLPPSNINCENNNCVPVY